jgi:hypothetical protein
MLEVLVVLVSILLITASFIWSELGRINTTLRKCLDVLNEISYNTNEIKDNTDREAGYEE